MERNLTYCLRKLNTLQRAELCMRLDISDETLDRRIKQPGKFSLDDAMPLVNFLQEVFQQEWDGLHLLFGNVSVAQPEKAA